MAPLDRNTEFGQLGKALLSALDQAPHLVDNYDGMPLTQQLIQFSTHVTSLREVDPLLVFAVSLLCVDYPVQCDARPDDIRLLSRHAFCFSSFLRPDPVTRTLLRDTYNIQTKQKNIKTYLAYLCSSSPSARHSLWPPKRHQLAGVKANIRLGPLATATIRQYGAAWLGSIVAPLIGTHDDAVCGAILMATALTPHFATYGVQLATALVSEPDNAKGLSNAIKALGWNSSFPGSMLVEGIALQGRGVAPVDLSKEIAYRTDPDLVRESVISDAAEMAPHIRAVLDLELPSNSGLGSLEEFWSARWLWCVNGAENRASDRALGLPPPPKGAKRYRRMAAEEVQHNPIPAWDGTTSVSASQKLEAGKTRAIFACDTSSYFAFSWVLDRAQRDWRGHRILLDPGSGGLYGVAHRVRGAQGRGGVNVMLDYDDFNSHHATDVQQELIRQLCTKYNAPAWYTTALVESFDKMYINDGGRPRRVLGTLMSGHRGTSFINSVLNAAYIRAAVGGAFFDSLISLHAGDDVYMRCKTLSEAAHVLERCKAFGCRMNPSKQSIGFRHAEFLRLGIGDRYATGYLARSISSLVSGSWVSPDPLSPEDGLVSAITTTRSCINRGCPPSVSRLIARTYSSIYGYPLKVLERLLSGEACLQGGAVYNTDYNIRQYSLQRPRPEDIPLPPSHREYASREYLANHVSPVEARAIQLAGADMTQVMVRSSYSKGIERHPSPLMSRVRPTLTALPVVRATGFITMGELAKRKVPRGHLAHYPLLRLVADRLSDSQLSELLVLNGTPHGTLPPRIAAFGTDKHCCNIVGWLPYSDACFYSKMTTCDNIITTYPVYS
ncbi:RNA-dependent RNA polymerase [Colletotrichum fructicola victorivirus 1]|nr:RNA-dependent RNA polymerase [Colletotrichum fructicola victorivirus 1]